MPSVFDVASTSAGEMFLGAFVPGLVLVALYMLFILAFAFFRPAYAPAVHYDGKFDAKFWGKVLLTLVPPLALIVLVLGSIIAGIATVNQAGAIGAAGAMLMAGYRLTEGSRTSFYPAILAIISLVLIGFVLSNYEMNIKAAETAEEWTGIYLGAAASLLLLFSLIWSGWRVLNIEDTLRGVMLETAKTTSLVFIILLGAAMLTAAFRAFGGEDLVRDFLNSLPGGFWSKFIIVMAVIFVLGFFLDFIEIAVVVVPIVAPILLADPSANITAVWLGVMIGLNIQTSFLTPPFGFALFYLRGVAPAIVKTVQMYKGVIAFICLQLLALGIVGIYPQLVNYLPNRVSLLSETAPPPRNPKLQLCVEEYVAGKFAENGTAINAAIGNAEKLDLSALPKKMQGDISKAIANAGNAMGLLDAATAAGKIVTDASENYRPAHGTVRDIQRAMRHEDGKMAELKTRIGRLNSEADKPLRERLEGLSASYKAEKENLAAMIPAEWDKTFKDYTKLVKAERDARNKYRRAVDTAYEPVVKMLQILDGNEKFAALEQKLADMKGKVEADKPEDMIAPLEALASQFGGVEGASKIKSQIGKARRALKSKKQDKAKAMKALDKAADIYAEQKAWRGDAKQKVGPGLEAYEEAVRGTIGLRMQKRLPREPALFVAGCNSGHRDISLNF